MNKHLIIVLIQLYFLSNSIFAQDFWELLPFPDNQNISTLKVNSAGEIFVGTVTGYQDNGIFRSDNDGLTWEMMLNTRNFQIFAISINPIGNIFVGTGDGFYPFLASFDNGLSWDTIPVPFSSGFGEIAFYGQDTVLVGTGAYNGAIVLSTPDLGMSWDTLFLTENHTSEYVADIAIAPSGDIAIGLGCYLPDMGGLFRSTNGGADWEFLGLFNRMVENLEYNAQGDLIIGVRGGYDGTGGIYAIYHDNPDQIVECLAGPNINGLSLNSAGDIFAGSGSPNGIIRSTDNGQTFEFINGGLPFGEMGSLEKDYNDYIYALIDGGSHYLFRTISPTVTGINKLPDHDKNGSLFVFPTPVSEVLQGKIYDKLPDGIYKYTITDITGRLIASNRLHVFQNSFSMNVSFLSKGYYVFTIYSNELTYSAKFIKS
ncbi:MAG: T9SS type A sorting domain-containing protein [Lentimicrobium sp.]|nr:T9SS type A sorting domain-containing protein [Lentimicrobium sp.]